MTVSEPLRALFQRISEISSIPAIALRIMATANDDRAGADELLEAVALDPALAARLLRTINSSRYSLVRTIGDLKTAIVLLGHREVRQLAFTAYVAGMFRGGAPYREYRRENLWGHMTSVGEIARLVARAQGLPVLKEDEAFLAGLLHDIGYILIDQHLQRHFRGILDEAAATLRPTCEIEREVLAFDHAQLGGFLAAQWHFPERVRVAIEFHHAPLEYDGDERELLYPVVIANYLATHSGQSALGIRNVPPPSDAILAGAGLTRGQVLALWESLDETLAKGRLLAAV